LQKLPAGGNCDKFGLVAGTPSNVSQKLAAGGNNCDKFGRRRA